MGYLLVLAGLCNLTLAIVILDQLDHRFCCKNDSPRKRLWTGALAFCISVGFWIYAVR